MNAPQVVISYEGPPGVRHYEVRGLDPNGNRGPGSEPKFTVDTLASLIIFLVPELYARMVDDYRIAERQGVDFGGPDGWRRRAGDDLRALIQRRCP